MPDLTWKPANPGEENAYSGDLLVGYVAQLDDKSGYTFCLSAVHTKFITIGDGDKKNINQAKQAVQQAWDEWCIKAGLIRKKK